MPCLLMLRDNAIFRSRFSIEMMLYEIEMGCIELNWIDSGEASDTSSSIYSIKAHTQSTHHPHSPPRPLHQ